MEKDFFISYNRADRTWAEWIAWQLEEAGYTTVLQAWDFGPGSNFALKTRHPSSHQRVTSGSRIITIPDHATQPIPLGSRIVIVNASGTTRALARSAAVVLT